MKKVDINELIDKFLKLYNLYESYAFKDEKVSININVYKNFFILELIYKTSYRNNVLDYITFKFENNENTIYEYFTTFIFYKIYENVIVSYDESRFYNEKHKGYLNFIVKDSDMLDKILSIKEDINNYNNEKCYCLKFGSITEYVSIDNGLSIFYRENNVEATRKYGFDTVTDEDVAKPDLTGYSYIQQEN